MQELKWCQLELKRAITTSHEASRAQSLADPEQHPDEAIGWIGELMVDDEANPAKQVTTVLERGETEQRTRYISASKA